MSAGAHLDDLEDRVIELEHSIEQLRNGLSGFVVGTPLSTMERRLESALADRDSCQKQIRAVTDLLVEIGVILGLSGALHADSLKQAAVEAAASLAEKTRT